jgi:hypothetical protein
MYEVISFVTSPSHNCVRIDGYPVYPTCLLSHHAILYWREIGFSSYGKAVFAGSSPDEVDFFNLPNPSSRTMVLGSTQPLTEMSTRNHPGG